MDNDSFEHLTYGELLNRAAARWGDQEAIVFEEQRYTYSDLRKHVDQLAKGLIEIGVQKGDKVSVWLNNCPEWLFYFYAVAKIGGVLVPVNTRFKASELAYVIGQSDSSVLVIGKPYRTTNYFDIVKEAVPDLQALKPDEMISQDFPYLRRIITVGDTYPGALTHEGVFQLGTQVADSVLEQREAEVDSGDIFNILYTSGTTGFPKGAMHSHKMIVNMRDAADRLQMTEKDRILLFLPLFHVFGSLAGATAACTKGACLVLMEAFDAGIALQRIEEEGITLIYAFETMFFDMMNHPDFNRYSRASLRSGICPVPPYVAKQVLEKFCHVANGYGMTETTSLTSLSLPDDPFDKIINSNGKPLPGFSVKVVDPDTGDELPANHSGELCVKGHPVMLGYYKKPEETKKVIDQDGWFHTGDRANLDEEGYVHIVGRIKDMIRVGGENVDPVEVEAMLSKHPSVYRVSVVSMPHERLGEAVAAFVQLRENMSVPPTELIDYCKNKIASFKIPKKIFFIDEFPMTPTGKIQKYLLRERAKEQAESEMNS